MRAPLAVCAYGGRPAGLQDPVDDQDDRNGDLVALARRRAQRQSAAPDADGFGLGEFMRKLRAAWQIFFPERPRPLTPKEEGKRRLRMILVADRWVPGRAARHPAGRGTACTALWQAPLPEPGTSLVHRCGMSQESLADMRANIVRVVSDYVDIEADDLVEVGAGRAAGGACLASRVGGGPFSRQALGLPVRSAAGWHAWALRLGPLLPARSWWWLGCPAADVPPCSSLELRVLGAQAHSRCCGLPLLPPSRAAQVNLSMDPELGTIYSVAVPVKRVKPQARVPLDGDADPDGITLSVRA